MTDQEGNEVGSTYLRDVMENASVPFPTPMAEAVNVEVEVWAKEGPRLEAARLTSGCNLRDPVRTSPPCFGEKPENLKSRAYVFLGFGAGVMALASCCVLAACRMCFKGD